MAKLFYFWQTVSKKGHNAKRSLVLKLSYPTNDENRSFWEEIVGYLFSINLYHGLSSLNYFIAL